MLNWHFSVICYEVIIRTTLLKLYQYQFEPNVKGILHKKHMWYRILSCDELSVNNAMRMFVWYTRWWLICTFFSEKIWRHYKTSWFHYKMQGHIKLGCVWYDVNQKYCDGNCSSQLHNSPSRAIRCPLHQLYYLPSVPHHAYTCICNAILLNVKADHYYVFNFHRYFSAS